jgi:hypothetical protein
MGKTFLAKKVRVGVQFFRTMLTCQNLAAKFVSSWRYFTCGYNAATSATATSWKCARSRREGGGEKGDIW